MRKSLLVILLLFVYQICSAQLVFTPLYRNYAIKDYLSHKPEESQLKGTSTFVADTINLPFIDDFSGTNVYPDNNLWIDRQVFINNTYSNYIKLPGAPPTRDSIGDNAPNINIATFDGFDEKGNTYSNSATAYGYCDTLTSKPIDLRALDPNNPAADSTYLSFFIQPKGIGLNLEPERLDSLILQFKNPTTNTWHFLKGYVGYTAQEIKDGKVFPFRREMIPIKNPVYFQKGFQFRFINKGSLYGADDIWNIDHVELDRGRNINDTLLPDASFNANPSSFLNGYTAVPYNQFTPALIANNHWVAIRNNFNVQKSIGLIYTAYNITNNQFIDSTSRDISAFSPEATRYEASLKVNPFNVGGPSVVRTRYTISTSGDNFPDNNVIDLYTQFNNYFAYDDGSAEGGIGLKTTGDGRFAVQFQLNQPDTITSVRMYFNRFMKNVSNNLFTLTIWRSITPGSDDQDIAYQKISLHPQYDSSINGFVEYKIEADSFVILPAGQFYVGWVQNVDYDLNLGFDLNTDNGSKIFYNVTTAGWQQASIYGAPMIRPVFADRTNNTGLSLSKKIGSLSVYPNPANDIVHISYKDENHSSYTIEILDMIGRNKMTLQDSPDKIDVSQLEKGIYMIRLVDHRTNLSYVGKFIKL